MRVIPASSSPRALRSCVGHVAASHHSPLVAAAIAMASLRTANVDAADAPLACLLLSLGCCAGGARWAAEQLPVAGSMRGMEKSAMTMARGSALRCISGGARCLALGAVLLVQPAAAASPASQGATQTSRDRIAAQALFDEGRELMQNGLPSEACPRFEESNRLEPGLGTRFHLATCYEALGKLASAHALFLEVAAEAKQRGQDERERVARQKAQALEPRLSRLTVEVPFSSSPELRIERDGTPIGSAQWGLAVPVDPGRHRVSASAPGRSPWSTEVSVAAEGAFTRVEVPPLVETQQSFFAPTTRKLGLAALGVGVGTIALGSVFTVQAISKKDASKEAGCSNDRCPTEEGLSLRQQAISAGQRATWAMSIGAVGLGAAAALFWLVPTGEENALEVTPTADREGASLYVNGRF